MSRSPFQPVRDPITIRWRPLEGAGLEHCEIRANADGIAVRSVLVGERDGHSFGARYEIELDPGWVFRRLRLQKTDGTVLVLNSDGRGRWTDGDSRRLAQLDGCIDIDLSGTPFTNTLPIRRATFAIGVPQRFNIAWIPLDTLEPFADVQTYTRLDDRRFLYGSSDGLFKAELDIDDAGLVTHYPTLFERL